MKASGSIFVFAVFMSLAGRCYGQHKAPPTDSLEISGQGYGHSYSLTDLEKMPQTELGDISIKNHRGEVKRTLRHAKGVLLIELLAKAGIDTEKPKELSQYYFVLTASDNYKNVYSWNELFNSETGNKVYIITGKEGKGISDAEDRIAAISLTDLNTGMRYIRGLARINIKKEE